MVVFEGTNRFKLSHKSLTIATLYLIHTNHRPKNRPFFQDQKNRPIVSPIFCQDFGEFCL